MHRYSFQPFCIPVEITLQLMADAELQVKPEPEDTAMPMDVSPYSAPPPSQPIKAEGPTQPPAGPSADLPGASVQQAGDAANAGGSAASLPFSASAMPHAGSLTPESSAQVAQAKSYRV